MLPTEQVEIAWLKEIHHELKAINNKLTFFVVITVVPIVLYLLIACGAALIAAGNR